MSPKIISAKVILPAWDQAPLWNGALLIEKGRVVAVAPKEELKSHHPEVETVDFPHGLIIPGLVNTHTHAPMTIFRGLADDLPLMTWLEKYIFPVERHLKRAWVYWGSKLALAEMLRSGVTLFADMYLFEPEVIKATEETGLRGVLGEGLFDFPSPGYGPLEKGLALTRELLETYASHPKIKIMVCPHATYTCSPETLRQAKEIADQFGALVHIHLSETREEVSLIKARYGKRPPELLLHCGLLEENLLVAHAVQLRDEEIDLFAQKKVKVAHCPESNLKLGSGVAPIPALLEAGVSVGLGTDGPASNNDLDLLTEMRTAALIQKGLAFDPTVLPARDVFRMATELGAQALGFENCGRLAPGFWADLAVVDLGQSHLHPLYDPLSLLIYSARGGDIKDVMIGGEFVMRQGRLLSFDEEETKQRVSEIALEIKEVLSKERLS